MAASEDDVAAAVGWAAKVRAETGERVPFSVRSGGHGISGSSTNDGGIVVDLSGVNRVELLDDGGGSGDGLVQVQGGATWGDVAPVLAVHDLALTSGNFGDTGVGGLATSGGLGYFARSQGLTLDHVRRVKVVTADGNLRWVDAEHEPDLFWAMRGGATQAGIAVDFVFDAPRIGSDNGGAAIISQEAQLLTADLASFTSDWGDWVRTSPRQLESFLTIHAVGGDGWVVQARNVWANDDVGAATPVLQAGLELARPLQNSAHITTYPSIVPAPKWPHQGQQRIRMRDVLVDRVDADLGTAIAESLSHPATALAELRAMGGAISHVPVDAMAWAGRSQEVLAATWIQPTELEAEDASFAPIEALGTGMYGAYSSDTRPEAAALAWPGETGRRLREVSQRVDPDRLFDRGLTLPR